MEKFLKIRLVVFSFVLWLALTAVVYSQIYPENEKLFKVIKVNILGNERIEKDAIYPYISTKPGDIFDPEKIKKDVESIYRMGFFENVLVNYHKLEKGIEITFIVFEKPYIRMINFKGIKELKKSEITKELKTKPFSVLNEEQLKKDIEKIRDIYQEKGFYGVKVKYKISKPVNHRVVVDIIINEGIKSKVDEVIFKGNEHLSHREIQKAIYTRPYSWLLSWWTGTGYLKKTELEKDVKRIENVYHKNGYVRVKVFDPIVKLKNHGKEIDVIFKIEEGKRYKFGKVQIIDPQEKDKKKIEKLLKEISCQEGEYFSNLAIHNDITKLTDIYADRGYAYADVMPKTEINDEKLTVDVSFRIDRGNLYKFREISIEGNTYTRDKVIRRELRIYEQDTYTSTGLKRSRGNLKRTGFFNEVDITTKKVSDHEIDATVKVSETPTGTLSFGGGYSSSDTFVLTGSVSQNNLFGKGYKLKVDGTLSGRTNRYSVEFTDPAILDTSVSFGLALFSIDTEYDNFDTLTKGFGLTFGKRVTDFFRWDLSYYFEQVRTYNIDDNAAQYIKDEEGTTTISSISLALNKDTRDDYYYPLTGVKQKLYIEFNGGPIGGDEDFYRIVGESIWFYPISKKNKIVFDFRLKLGYADGFSGNDVPAWKRFYVGGLKTIRGFDYGKAGPRDESGDVKGGTKEIITNTEINFPIYEEIALRGVVFFDAGRAYDDDETFLSDIRTSVGCGIRWRSPFGPIRIEWGLNLSPKSDEKSSVFGFSMGTMF